MPGIEMRPSKPKNRKFLRSLATVLAFGSTAMLAQAMTLRIVSYNIDCSDESSDANITGSAHSLPTVIQAIGLHHLGTNAQQVDILGCEELQSTSLANFVTALNNIYGAGTYTYDMTTDPNTGGGPDGIIYNPSRVQIISARALLTGQNVLLQSNGTYTAAHSPGGGVNGVTRAPMVYQFRPVGFTSADDFYMYVSHARSTSDDSQGDARYAEAQEVRSDAKYKLPAGSHILYSGDWNLFNGSGENAYKCLTGQTTSDSINWADNSSVWANTNQTQAYDPTSKTSPPTTTTWANVSGDNATYLYGDSTASLTSRIDIQLPNALMFGAYNSQGGVQLAPDTSDPYDTSGFPSAKYPFAFEVFGNNGSTPRSSACTSSSNHSLDDLSSTTPSASTVKTDEYETGSGTSFMGSDHYPIFGDYNVVVPQAPPVANFTATPTNGPLPLAVTFSDASTGSITNYQWTFGDGNQTNVTTSNSFSYIYTSAGVYSVTETVTGPGGSNSLTLNNLITVLAPPVANFNAAPTNGVGSLTVTFTDASTGNIANYSWAFGDGNVTNVTTSASFTYTYSNAGIYSVTETVTGPGGVNSLTATNLITVLTPFQAWQLQYFGCTNCPQAQLTADADGTGQNNNFKYVAGLDPTNAASVFTFGTSGTNLTFSPIVAGRSYVVLYTTDLTAPNWLPLTTGVTNINGNQAIIVDTDTGETAKFYSLEIVGP